MTVDAPDKSMRMSGIQGLRLDPPLAEVRQSPGTPEMSRMRGRGWRPFPGAPETPRGRNRGASNGRLPSSTPSQQTEPKPKPHNQISASGGLNKTPACL